TSGVKILRLIAARLPCARPRPADPINRSPAQSCTGEHPRTPTAVGAGAVAGLRKYLARDRGRGRPCSGRYRARWVESAPPVRQSGGRVALTRGGPSPAAP